MVAIAQVVEHLVVVEGVAGSSPVSHPIVHEGPSQSGRPFVHPRPFPSVGWRNTRAPGQRHTRALRGSGCHLSAISDTRLPAGRTAATQDGAAATGTSSPGSTQMV